MKYFRKNISSDDGKRELKNEKKYCLVNPYPTPPNLPPPLMKIKTRMHGIMFLLHKGSKSFFMELNATAYNAMYDA